MNFDEFWVRERFSLGKVDFMGLVTLDNNLKNIYDVGYSPNEKQFPGYSKGQSLLETSKNKITSNKLFITNIEKSFETLTLNDLDMTLRSLELS